MSDYDGGRTSSTTASGRASSTTTLETIDYSKPPTKSEISTGLLDADDIPNAVSTTELNDTINVYSGENITTVDGYVIDTNSFFKNGYTYTDQRPYNQVYNFEKVSASDPELISDFSLSSTAGSVYIIEQIGKNVGATGASSLNDYITVQHVKIFGYAEFNTVYFNAYVPQSTTTGVITHISNPPYNYVDVGSNPFIEGSNIDEGNNLDRKFSFDGSTAPTQAYQFTQSKVNDLADKIINDLENNVLSRFDVLKTTTPLQLTEDRFENITSDEIAEASTPSGVIITETNTSPSGGGSTTDGGAY